MIETLIVGGGLSGLALADRLHQAGRDFRLVEARARLGGRVLTRAIAGGQFDMGPAWFWPGQPLMAEAVQRFALPVFEQHAQGRLLFEDASGRGRPNAGFASMAGSLRLDGGMGRLVSAFAAALPPDRISTGVILEALTLTRDGVRADLRGPGGRQAVQARQVALAIPPRLAAEISYTPALPQKTRATLRAIPTWMAGQAKIVAVYAQPYWRDAGFSGDAASQRGPMVEIHDASPASGGPHALFGFVGIAPDVRLAHRGELLDAAREQLARMFGPAMASPLNLELQDWAHEPLTATSADHRPLTAHPDYSGLSGLDGGWGPQLRFTSSEMAPEMGGYLEGALAAARQAAQACIAMRGIPTAI